uniref:Transmembrane protein 183A n=1 Tax=Anas platyrhynchos TaxID=8839 RepID=A0A8B9TLN5_ANAPL
VRTGRDMAPRGRPEAAAMPKRGARKRLKFRADDVCSERVTVADYANSDPAVVKSGRVKKAVANAVQQEVKSLCGLEASCVPSEEVLHYTNAPALYLEDPDGDGGEEYPIDIWLLLASYIRPEDIVRFSLICKKAWTVTCTAAFWTRLYRRHYSLDAYLPLRLRPESMEKLHCLRACVIRSLYHMYEPFASRVSRNPAIPDSTPSTLKNSRVSGIAKEVGCVGDLNVSLSLKSPRFKSKCCKGLQPPIQYEEVHTNPDQDCCLLQITTFNFIFVPIVMGMTFTLFTINVSTDMRHHRVRLVFQDAPVRNGKKPRLDQGVQVVLDPVHSVRLLDWWHPQYPFSPKA